MASRQERLHARDFTRAAAWPAKGFQPACSLGASVTLMRTARNSRGVPCSTARRGSGTVRNRSTAMSKYGRSRASSRSAAIDRLSPPSTSGVEPAAEAAEDGDCVVGGGLRAPRGPASPAAARTGAVRCRPRRSGRARAGCPPWRSRAAACCPANTPGRVAAQPDQQDRRPCGRRRHGQQIRPVPRRRAAIAEGTGHDIRRCCHRRRGTGDDLAAHRRWSSRSARAAP